MKDLRIGLLGAGTVGRGLIELLENRELALQKRIGRNLRIVAVADRSYAQKSFLQGKSFKVSDDPSLVLDNPDVDVAVELIGGLEPARQWVLQALANGKHVVTANKALLANHGKEIFEEARKAGKEIGLEAAVAGALPVIRNLRRVWIGSEIQEMFGILNGTCNFIITRMQKEDMPYEQALAIAQEKGFAEADPTFDVSGRDAAQKLAILSSLAFDHLVQEADIRVEGITELSPLDHAMALRMGRVIRLLAVAKKKSDGYHLRVHPALIDASHLLASVEEENNALFTNDPYSGPTMIVGRGAGAHPTASAVLGDIAAIARIEDGSPEVWLSGTEKLQCAADAWYRFYLRFRTLDRAGVLASISRVLADHEISIASMHQEEGSEPVDVVILTHDARESNLAHALELINKMEIVRAPTVALRLEEPGK
ncbi:MAG: homoserine dehydrogenase [Leptospiraceae bacterium]|nr:homoserine dehydrogenase [Leptospiraceae bacterium]